MLFRTRYGTKVTIKSEALAKDNIEPYIPCAINANCLVLEEGDVLPSFEAKTQTEDIPDILLDECAAENILETECSPVIDAGMGNYVFQEAGLVMPNLVKSTEVDSE